MAASRAMDAMLSQRERVVQVAREWIGTPFQAGCDAVKGRGCDCGSFLAAVFAEAGAIASPDLGQYDYLAPCMNGDPFYIARISEHADLIRESQAAPGDIVVYRMGRGFSHAALVADWPREVIHAAQPRGVTVAHGALGRLGGRPRLFYRMRALR